MGVTFWQLITGKQPFTASTGAQLAQAITLEGIPPLPEHVPEDLRSTIRQMTQLDPSARPQAGQDIIASLEGHDDKRYQLPPPESARKNSNSNAARSYSTKCCQILSAIPIPAMLMNTSRQNHCCQ